MGESQSRFSIIEELTTKKLDAEERIKDLDNELTTNKFAEKQWEKEVLLEREKMEDKTAMLKEKNDREQEMLKEKIKELDKGIDTIQKISDAEKVKDK